MSGDFTQVTSVWPVLALTAFFGIPAFFSWLNSREAKSHAKAAYDETIHQANPNSGKSLKDSLNRIEATLATQGTTQEQQGEALSDVVTRLSTLETAAEKRGRRSIWWR